MVKQGTEPRPSDPLGSLLSSTAKGDLLVLFHRNPGLIDTIEGIARRLGKRGKAIESDVSELAAASILEKKKVGSSDVYFLNKKKDQEAQKEIANYISELGKGRASR